MTSSSARMNAIIRADERIHSSALMNAIISADERELPYFEGLQDLCSGAAGWTPLWGGALRRRVAGRYRMV